MCFDSYSLPPNSSQIPPPTSLFIHLCVLFVLFLKTNQEQLVLPKYSSMCAFYWSMVDLPGAPLSRENCLLFSQNLTVANISMTKGEISVPSPLCMLGLGVPWACTDLVYAITATTSSYVQLSCWVPRTLLPCSHPLP